MMRSARILLVEDDPGDQELVWRALQDCVDIDLRIASDGEEALDYLFHRGRYVEHGSAPRPDLILLDLNLPGTSGIQVLRAMKQDQRLRRTPVVVLTTSAKTPDIEQSYALGCNSYVVKPLEAHAFFKTCRDLANYWFALVALPVD